MNKKYFYIVMSQQDLLENQVIEEIIRERNNYYINRENSLNFWILMSPSFLLKNEIFNHIKKSNFYQLKKTDIIYNDSFYNGVIISTDFEYINWLKLRLGYFENISTNQIDSRFKSDGLYGEIEIKNSLNSLIFEKNKISIHPKILTKVYAESFESFLNLV